MDSIWMYFFKVGLLSLILYVIYLVLFSKTTFHRWNRFLLLSILLFSTICPILQFGATINLQITGFEYRSGEFEEVLAAGLTGTQAIAAGNTLLLMKLILMGYLLITLVFLLRIGNQIYQFVRLKNASILEKQGDLTFVLSDRFDGPFSFFNWIFLPRNQTTIIGLDVMIEHESVHYKELHTIDLLFSEIYCAVFWFNPIAWHIKKSLRMTHEYLADCAMVSNRIKPDEYLKILLTGTESRILKGVANYFKSSTIKNRIKMIKKNRSSNIKQLRYLILMPVIAILVMAFSIKKSENNPPSIRPVDGGEIAVNFGYGGVHPITKKDYVHNGIDIKAPMGTPVKSASDGIVAKARSKGGWGNLIVIKHDEEFETWYGHLQDFSVKEGEKVSKGQVIGHVGTTGYSTGPHLHYEVRKNGEKVDPVDYFK